MLEMIIASADDEARLVPDDLGPDLEASGLEAGHEGIRLQGGVPAVDYVAVEQCPCLSPIGTIVVEHGSLGQPIRGNAALFSPGGVILHAVRRVGHAEVWLHAFEYALDIGRVGAVT